MNLNTKTKLNALGRIIENKGVSYTKIARHLGLTRQGVWIKTHEPTDPRSIRISFYEQLATFLDMNPLMLLYQVLKDKPKEKTKKE